MYICNIVHNLLFYSHIFIILCHQILKFSRIITCDWKALSIIRGIKGAQCPYFRMWYHCSKKQICDFSSKYITLSILKKYNSLNLYITLQSSISILVPSWPIQRCPLEQVRKLSENTFGHKEKDLRPFIPYDDMPVDDLHLRIRISQKLF